MNGANALQRVGPLPGWETEGIQVAQLKPGGLTKAGTLGGTAVTGFDMPVATEVDEVTHADALAASLLRPPPPALREVDARTAARAWDSVMKVLSGALRAAAAADRHDEQGLQLALNDLGEATDSMQEFYGRVLNPEAVLLQLQLESGRFTAEMTKANLDHAIALRKEEVAKIEEKQRKEQEAADKQRELAHKVGKGQIAAMVLGWATSLAQVVTGALKIATGQPQGSVDVLAGLVGLAKCTLQTIEMAHPELAAKLQPHIKELAKWETGLSVAAGVTSLITVARMAKVANMLLGKAATELLTTGADEAGKRVSSVGVTLVNAMDKGGDAAEAASQLVKNIASTLVDDVAAQLRNSLRLAGGSQKLVNALAKSFSNEALQHLVEQSIWQAAKQMRGLTTEAITTAFIDQVKRQMLKAVVRAVVSFSAAVDAPLTLMKTVAPIAQQITNESLRIHGAKVKEEIERMMIFAMMLQFAIDQIGRDLKQNKNALERVTQDHIENTESITNAVGEVRDAALQAASVV